MAKASPTACPACDREMSLIDRSTMSGDDMRTYRCDDCRQEHIVNFGTALWKALSDARSSDNGAS
jgi:transposase-like protein